jgi:sulfur carrier protein ThiS
MQGQEMVKVSLIVIGGKNATVEVPKGSSVSAILKKGGIDASNFQVRNNGQTLEGADEIVSDTKLIISRQIEGN